jgi:hypothetical protein
VICAAGTVTLTRGTPLAVFAQRQYGVNVGMKSPVVSEPYDALVYVTKKSCPFCVFVAARLTSGTGVPDEHSVAGYEIIGPIPPCCGP